MFPVLKASKALLPSSSLKLNHLLLPYTRTAFSAFSADSFTVSYLVNSCGLSPESAVAASSNVNLDSPLKPDSVLNLLQTRGFSQAQISRLVQKFPRVLVADPVNTLLPKLDFFRSIGVSDSVLSRILSDDPYVLRTSLSNHIIPCYTLLRKLFGCNEKLVTAIGKVWSKGDYTIFSRNVELLREFGVPDSSVVRFLSNSKYYSEALCQKNDVFLNTLNRVKEMGFDVKMSAFLVAVTTVSVGSSARWERCYEAYTNTWGWSHDEVMVAFKKQPSCMCLSEKKLMTVMQYLVEEMGWSANSIANYPNIILRSLDKTIKPRCRVVQVLSKKGIVKQKDVNLCSLLIQKEAYFLRKFVDAYLQQLPQLLAVYKGQINVSDVL